MQGFTTQKSKNSQLSHNCLPGPSVCLFAPGKNSLLTSLADPLFFRSFRLLTSLQTGAMLLTTGTDPAPIHSFRRTNRPGRSPTPLRRLPRTGHPAGRGRRVRAVRIRTARSVVVVLAGAVLVELLAVVTLPVPLVLAAGVLLPVSCTPSSRPVMSVPSVSPVVPTSCESAGAVGWVMPDCFVFKVAAACEASPAPIIPAPL